MSLAEAGEFIRNKVREAENRGLWLTREQYGVTQTWDGVLVPDGRDICGLGACILGEHSVREGTPDAIDDALRQLGISPEAEQEFIVGFDDGKRNTPWQRLGDDIATEFIGPRELFSEPVDIDDD